MYQYEHILNVEKYNVLFTFCIFVVKMNLFKEKI